MEHKLQIEFIHSKNRLLPKFLRRYSQIIQTKPFDIGLRLKNTGNVPIQGITIKNIQWRSADGKDMLSWVDNSFHFDTLNPREEKEIWADKMGTYVHGLCTISLLVISDNPEDTIQTYQIDPFTKRPSPCRDKNNWVDFFFIRSKSEYEQTLTNRLLVIYTAIGLGIAMATLYYIKIQTEPIFNTKEKNQADAQEYCRSNPTGKWPKASGGYFTCDEVFRILGAGTTSLQK